MFHEIILYIFMVSNNIIQTFSEIHSSLEIKNTLKTRVFSTCSYLINYWYFHKGNQRGRESSDTVGESRRHHSGSPKPICTMHRVQTGRVDLVTQFEPVLLTNLQRKDLDTESSS